MPGNAVYATAAELSRFSAISSKSPSSNGKDLDTLVVKGWKFSSFHDKMIDSATLDAMQHDLCSGFPDYKMHIPPMIFGHDVMTMQKMSDEGSTSFTLALTARDALHSWSEQHSKARTDNKPLHIVQVPYAKDWVERSRPHNISPSAREVPEAKDDDSDTSISIDESIAHRAWDWTFSSDYCGSVTQSGAAEPFIISMYGLDAASVFDDTFAMTRGLHEDTHSGIDMNLLRQRDVPILFYDEVLLYQDDLEDCGEVAFDAKLRVMPLCWFVLMRMFLRIDGVIVRIRESRYYHRFGENQVHLEVTWKECAIGAQEPAVALPYPLPPCELNPADLRDPNKLSQVVPVCSQRFFHFEC